MRPSMTKKISIIFFDVMETEAARQDHVWLLAKVCVYVSNKIIYIYIFFSNETTSTKLNKTKLKNIFLLWHFIKLANVIKKTTTTSVLFWKINRKQTGHKYREQIQSSIYNWVQRFFTVDLVDPEGTNSISTTKAENQQLDAVRITSLFRWT